MLLVQIIVKLILESLWCFLHCLHCKQAVFLAHCDRTLQNANVSVVVFVSCVLNQVARCKFTVTQTYLSISVQWELQMPIGLPSSAARISSLVRRLDQDMQRFIAVFAELFELRKSLLAVTFS